VIIFIGKVSRSINFSSLFYVFALSLFETLHSINNLAVSVKSFYDQLSLKNLTEILEDIPLLYTNDKLLYSVSHFLATDAAELRGNYKEDLAKFIQKYTEYSNEVLLNWNDWYMKPSRLLVTPSIESDDHDSTELYPSSSGTISARFDSAFFFSMNFPIKDNSNYF
jgi:hypothetical protein